MDYESPIRIRSLIRLSLLAIPVNMLWIGCFSSSLEMAALALACQVYPLCLIVSEANRRKIRQAVIPPAAPADRPS